MNLDFVWHPGLVLVAGGMDMGNVVSTPGFVRDLTDFARMNAVYATYFQTTPPARATPRRLTPEPDATLKMPSAFDSSAAMAAETTSST